MGSAPSCDPKKTPTKSVKTVWQICVDYPGLKKVTKKHAHPLLNVHDEIQRAAGHKFSWINAVEARMVSCGEFRSKTQLGVRSSSQTIRIDSGT